MQGKILVLLIGILLISCQKDKNEEILKKSNQDFYLGTYTDSLSEGIYKYRINERGEFHKIGLMARSENPSFLSKTKDNKYLLAVNEINNKDSVGTVESYLIENDTLNFINRKSSGGAHPCFVTVNNAGYILTANYTGANVGLLRIDKKGALEALYDVEQHLVMPGGDKKQIAHAHSAYFSDDNKHIVSVDLGTDELLFSTLDTLRKKLLPREPRRLKMENGAGPRHLTVHPNGKWIYVINELNSTITAVEKMEDDTYEKKGTVSTLPPGYAAKSFCADIHISWEGKFVYASNRGHNSIAVFKVNEQDGSLSIVEHESTRGNWPRNFALSPDEKFLIVANQHSNNVVSFSRDKTTGLLNFANEIEAPSPVCILF